MRLETLWAETLKPSPVNIKLPGWANSAHKSQSWIQSTISVKQTLHKHLKIRLNTNIIRADTSTVNIPGLMQDAYCEHNIPSNWAQNEPSHNNKRYCERFQIRGYRYYW